MFYSLHALLEDRVPPGLADDQIGPLYDYYAGEEGRVAGELHNFPLLVSLQTNHFTGVQTSQLSNTQKRNI